jgi:hypothetical protein
VEFLQCKCNVLHAGASVIGVFLYKDSHKKLLYQLVKSRRSHRCLSGLVASIVRVDRVLKFKFDTNRTSAPLFTVSQAGRWRVERERERERERFTREVEIILLHVQFDNKMLRCAKNFSIHLEKKYDYLANQPTQWNRVLPEKLIVTQLAEKFPAFYRTRRFTTAFTRARHWSLS